MNCSFQNFQKSLKCSLPAKSFILRLPSEESLWLSSAYCFINSTWKKSFSLWFSPIHRSVTYKEVYYRQEVIVSLRKVVTPSQFFQLTRNNGDKVSDSYRRSRGYSRSSITSSFCHLIKADQLGADFAKSRRIIDYSRCALVVRFVPYLSDFFWDKKDRISTVVLRF